jgi:iron complex outermembrane recepter protein
MIDRKFSVYRRMAFTALTTAFGAVSVFGQETAEDDVSGDVITMSVFSVDVSQDQGYRATNSISGTSLNVALQDLPMPVEVITSEFVEDLQATDFKESLAYTSGVSINEFNESSGINSAGANASYSAEQSPSSRGGVGGNFSNAINIRGYNVQFQNRMGFRVGGTVSEYGVTLGGALDSINYERLEVVRGPSSLLYGIGVLSGIVNIIPKRPLAENQYKLQASVGSDGYQRFTAEATGPLTDTLRYRVALADEERGHWTDFRDKDLEFFVAQLEYQPWDSVNIIAEYQKANTRYGGIGDQFIFDNLSDRSFGGDNRTAFNEQFNWQRDLGGVPNTYRITGPDTFEERDEWDSYVNIDIIPSENLTINIGGYWGAQESNRFDVEPATVNNQESNLFVKRRIRLGNSEPPNYRTIIQYVPDELITEYQNPPSPIFNDTTDFKTVRYYWMNTPQEGKFEQYRARANYTFETPFIGGSANHSLLLGRHDIKDTIDYEQGTELFPRLFEAVNLVREPAPSDTDSLEFRNVADLDPIRYNGELLAQPGREFQQTDIWYQGSYAVYQGNFWDDRMMLIAGLRHDRYQGLEKLYDRQEPATGVINNPTNETNGFLSEEYNFPEPISITTNTVAFRYDIREDLAVYALAAEGVSPNTGALDGNDEFIDAEQSLSKEIGLKFELLEGKLSGTISGYEIERTNAIWSFEFAPNPAGWVGGSNSEGNRGRPGQDFDPAEVLNGSGPIAYGVDSSYFDPADIARDPVTREWPFGIVALEGQHNGTPNPQTYVYLDYALLDEAGFRDEIEAAFRDSQRVRGFNSDEINSMFYTRTTGTFSGLNPSGVTGNTNVTFGDRARGFDMQLIYMPIENWQMIFNYAKTERTITEPFGMVAAIDQVTGTEFGTEYDYWVRAFGREAYGLEEIDNDGDGLPDQILRNGEPVSLTNIVPANSNTAGIEGANLYLGPEEEASFWNKYTFREGPLKRLSLMFGVRYTGEAATAVSVGGNNLQANLYPTPPTEARYQFDAGITYIRNWGDSQWRFALNVYNLTDDQKSYTEASYSNIDTGAIERRRTQLYHTPRAFRASVGVTF